MRRFSFLIVSLFMTMMLCTGAAYGQSVEYRTLSVEEMFSLADENNHRIRANSTSIEETKQAVGVAKNAYLPSIEASLSVSYNGDGTIMDRDFSHSCTAPIPVFGNNFALEVSQVIYAGEAIRNRVEIAELQVQKAVSSAENNRLEVRFLIVGNCLELRKIENQLQVFESHIIQTNKVLEHMRFRHQEGTALLNDITRYELQLENLNYTKIQLQNRRQILNNQLTVTLGLPQSTMIIPDPESFQSASAGSDEHWQTLALTSSPTLKIAQTGVSVNQYHEKIARSERRPQIAIFAANYLNGPVTIDIPALNKNFNYWTVGLGIKYNFGNLYKSGRKIRTNRLAVQRASQEKDAMEEELLLAVEAACIHYREAFSLLETKHKSVELASRNYNVVSNRYENDLALLTDLLDASSQKLDAELQEINAQINITYNYYKLRYLSGNL